MAKPILYKISPFSASAGTTVKFTYSGNQAYKNVATIYNATTMETVKTITTESMIYKFSIPKYALTNGTQYCVDVICYDKDGVASTISDKMYFWVLAQPSFYFSDLSTTESNTFNTQSPSVSLVYSQINGDTLSQFKFYIYNAEKTLLNSSDVFYDYSKYADYTYKGLDNATTYYIQAKGVTAKGIEVETSLVEIFVYYTNPATYALVYATADDCGIVNGYTNFTIIQPTRDKDTYYFSDGYIQLQNDVLIYNSDFNIEGDFTLGLKFRNADYDEIFKATNGTYTLTVSQILDENNHTRFKMVATGPLLDYVLYSGSFDDAPDDVFTVWVRRINNVYGLYVYWKYMYVEENGIWIGTDEPDSTVALLNDAWNDADITPTSHTLKEDVVKLIQDEEPADATVWIGGTDL